MPPVARSEAMDSSVLGGSILVYSGWLLPPWASVPHLKNYGEGPVLSLRPLP